MFAIMLDSVGGGEWLLLLAVVLVVIGPKNLPAAARKMGQVMSQLRRAADEFKRQIMTMDEEMRRTAENLKKEYIDIPEDDSKDEVADNSCDDGIYPDGDSYRDDYDSQPEEEYPDEYPGEDYYGATDECGNEVPSLDPDSETDSGTGETVEMASNGQDETNTEKS